NNRTEESIGTAHDFWVAYREGAFGKQPRPFVGWLMLVEDASGSRSPVKCDSPHYPVFEESKDNCLLCRNMGFKVKKKAASPGRYDEPGF
ncbi:MAG: hypothetical protein GY754_00010, partial [bacterium]|nr:hypothetical protein [bacterium]